MTEWCHQINIGCVGMYCREDHETCEWKGHKPDLTSAGPVGSSELLAGSEADGSETRPQSAGPIGRPDEPLVSKTGGVQCPYCDAYCWDKDHLVRHLTAGCE